MRLAFVPALGIFLWEGVAASAFQMEWIALHLDRWGKLDYSP